MSLNLEGLRIQCARRLYEDTLKKETGVSWFKLAKPIQEGYKKMVGAVFDELFRKPDHELYEFFCGKVFNLEDLAVAAGFVHKRVIKGTRSFDLEDVVSTKALRAWATMRGYSK